MPENSRSHELIQMYLDGRIDTADPVGAAELAELEQLLIADPSVAEALAEAARLQVNLTRHFQQRAKMAAVTEILNTSELNTSELAEAPICQISAERRIEEITFVPSPSVSRSDASRRSRPVGKRYAVPLAAALALLLMLFTVTSWVKESPAPQLLAGRIAFPGRVGVEVPENIPFQVVGETPAEIRLAGGALVKLFTSTWAIVKRVQQQAVVVLVSGRGEFTNHGNRVPLRVETDLGAVTTTRGKFLLELTMLAAGSAGVGARALEIEVVEGSVDIDAEGMTSSLAAPRKRVVLRQT